MEEIVQGLALNPTYKAQKGRIDFGIQSLAGKAIIKRNS